MRTSLILSCSSFGWKHSCQETECCKRIKLDLQNVTMKLSVCSGTNWYILFFDVSLMHVKWLIYLWSRELLRSLQLLCFHLNMQDSIINPHISCFGIDLIGLILSPQPLASHHALKYWNCSPTYTQELLPPYNLSCLSFLPLQPLLPSLVSVSMLLGKVSASLWAFLDTHFHVGSSEISLYNKYVDKNFPAAAAYNTISPYNRCSFQTSHVFTEKKH